MLQYLHHRCQETGTSGFQLLTTGGHMSPDGGAHCHYQAIISQYTDVLRRHVNTLNLQLYVPNISIRIFFKNYLNGQHPAGTGGTSLEKAPKFK